MKSRSYFKLLSVFLAGALVGAFSAVEVANGTTTSKQIAETQNQNAPGTTTQTKAGPSAAANATSSSVEGPGNAVQAAPPGLQCAPGHNGGATDRGVTATSINLATTTVQSGIGSAFLGDVKYAMEAVKNKVNRQGGICGRLLNIRYVDDAWQPDTGANDIRAFIHDGYFGMPVGPSSEGLNVVIKSGDIRAASFPVVGTDGMVILQYRDPWVWSVAAATVSTARIMVDDAYARGARKFSIVFDNNYKFGSEAAAAFNAEVRRLTKNNIAGYNKDNNCSQSYCGIQAGKSDYSGEVANFQHADFEAMFLEPTTALAWMSTVGAPTPSQVSKGIGAAQPLFTRDFATNCGAACDQMQVWTGYKAPIEDYANDPQVREYVSDLKRTNPSADEFNAFAEGGYVGMELLVQALQKVGPYLTHARLQAVLNSMTLQTGLTLQTSLRWSATNHFANTTMQAFTIERKGTFSGWRAGQVVVDKHPEYGTN
jgi:ABC-type branched-subunit amino acid transport system substrate-binding protein